MADRHSPDSEPTVRTLLRRVLDTADPRTPRPPRSASVRAQRALLESAPSRSQRSQTKAPARRSSHRIRSAGKVRHAQASGSLDEQTPRTLLKNILLTAPESSVMKPQRVVKPGPALPVAQPSRLPSSPGSPELQLPELEPPRTVAPGVLPASRRRQRLRLSVFRQGIDPTPPPPSQESHGNADVSGVTSSLSLTFATPVQPQSVQRPGLARRPLTRRAVDVGAFLQGLRDASPALVSPGDNPRPLGPLLAKDTVLEDTQPFSQPLAGSSPRHGSLPCSPHAVAGAERPVGPGTCGSTLRNNSPEQPAQHPAGEDEEAGEALAADLSSGKSVSGEDGAEPWQREALEEASGMRRESLAASRVREAAPVQGPIGAGELERDTEMTDTDGSCGVAEAMDTDVSSGAEDSAASPESASSIPEFPQTRKPRPSLEPGPPPTTAVIPSEPARLPSTAQIRGPRPRTTRPRTRQDPHKTGLSHYVKLFSFCAKMPVEKAALEMVERSLDKHLEHLCDDLGVYTAHAGRKTVMPEDLELLMRRQRLVTDHVPLHVLVERHLPLEYRQQLIPCASSGNSVFPAQ